MVTTMHLLSFIVALMFHGLIWVVFVVSVGGGVYNVVRKHDMTSALAKKICLGGFLTSALIIYLLYFY